MSFDAPIMLRIGLLSDTHGLLRPEAKAFLLGSDYIIHAGDSCDPGILKELAAIAPLTVVRGNCDKGPWAGRLRETGFLQAGELLICVIHDLAQFNFASSLAGVRVVVSGHSHKPMTEQRSGVLFVNPGSCGPRRFRLPVAVGELIVLGNAVSARIVELVIQEAAGLVQKHETS
jgi:putative phosphoesterase